MALIKPIELKNGIVVNYHRITTLIIVTNSQNIIEITSYIDEDKRKKEKANVDNQDFSEIYTHTEIINIPYDQTATIESTYEYLKTLSIFEGAEDG